MTEQLDYRINHLILPPRLPQKDDTTEENELSLLQFVLDGLQEYAGWTESEESQKWAACAKMLSQMIFVRTNKGFLEPERLQNALKNLCSGGKALHRKAKGICLTLPP